MCEMEVREGQRSSTIAQACAHNLFTVVGDSQMFGQVLRARGQTEEAAKLEEAADALGLAYQRYLDLFGLCVAQAVTGHGDHESRTQYGNGVFAAVKLAAEDVARADEVRARKHETR